MVTGFNVDVKHRDRVYHVQTEDRGRKNPVIETLVYAGGSIIYQDRTSYADKNDDDTYSEEEVARLLNRQHDRLVESIKNGIFDPDRRPFGEEFLTDRTLDECVVDFLTEELQKQHLSLMVVSQSPFGTGAKAHVVVRATHDLTQEPLAGVQIRARLIRNDGGPEPLPETETDASGEARLEFQVPDDVTVNAALIVQAESDIGRDELQKPIC